MSRRGARRRTAAVVLLSAGLLALGLLLAAPVLGAGPVVDGLALPWWLVAVAFAGVELVVLNVQTRREATAISLSELPLVVGLFFAAPEDLLLGRLLGATLVYLVQRRSSPLKVAFNAALVLAETAAALLVFSLVTGALDPTGPGGWLAAGAAAGTEQVVAVLAIARVIAVYEGSSDLRTTAADLGRALVQTAMTTVVALVAVAGLVQDRRNALLLGAAALVVMASFRAYAQLFDRHLSLERMYGFSQVVSTNPEVEDVLRTALHEARELLRAERAEVVVLPGTAGSLPVRVSLDEDGTLQRSRPPRVVEDDWLDDRLVRQGTAVLLERGTRSPADAHHLERRGWREAILVPLRGSTGVFGTLTVADRMGEVRAFDEQDVRLLETIANHAAVAVQNGRLIDELRHEALHDGLTGLPNRALLRELLQAALTDLRTRPGRCTAVMVLDLDGFKDVNDGLGHAAGDELLVEVAERLRSAVGTAGTVARLGGDEFAVLLPDVADEAAAARTARRLVESFGEPVELGESHVEVGASIGVAVAPAHGTDAGLLLKRADLAMYDAKGATGGLRVYEARLDASSERRLTLVAELRAALARRELTVVVQPQADLATREVHSVEALVRWTHPVLGSISPEEFVPVAERSGLVGPLTTFVLEESLQACARWRDAGCETAVAVNLSARSLLDDDLVDEVGLLLRRYDLPGRLLTLEVTESSVMSDPARAVGLLLRLRTLGVRLSVDDFGTGYSSLSYLRRLPVQEVKIDKSFVADLSGAGDTAIVRSIIDLGGNLGLSVLAEGIEDAATWQQLQAMGCSAGQGWHLSRPLPLDELLPWLQAYRVAAERPLRVVG